MWSLCAAIPKEHWTPNWTPAAPLGSRHTDKKPLSTGLLRYRGDWIRTSDRPAPSRVRYQTAPLPVVKRATGLEPVLRAWKAPVQPLTPRPRDALPWYPRASPHASFAPARLAAPRSSTGTSPASSASPGGGQAPAQLSRAPSSVTVEPLNARPSGEASSVTSQACSSTAPRRCRGTERAAPSLTVWGYFLVTSVAKCPAATAVTDTPDSCQRAASSRVSASTDARAAPE